MGNRPAERAPAGVAPARVVHYGARPHVEVTPSRRAMWSIARAPGPKLPNPNETNVQSHYPGRTAAAAARRALRRRSRSRIRAADRAVYRRRRSLFPAFAQRILGAR